MSGKLDFGEEDRSAALRQAWELALHLLSSRLSTVPYETYIRPLVPLKYEGNLITLGVASSFFREKLERQHANQIRSALEFHLDTTGLQVQFVVLSPEARQANVGSRRAAASPPDLTQPTLPLDDLEEDSQPQEMSPAPMVGETAVTAPEPATVALLESASPKAHATAKTSPRPTSTPTTTRTATRKPESKRPEPPAPETIPLLLNERYIFDNFLVGRSNQFAYAGAMSVAERPGEVYNPLFLYGPPGLGKTHLLHAIAHQIRRNRPEARVVYLSGASFAQSYIQAIQEHRTEEFRNQFRYLDAWLVDDIQSIASKEHTKEEFFHTFNMLYQGSKQIVIASDRSPRDLNTMDERLRSRFQSGLIADIGAPDLETRIAILQQYCEREQFGVPEDVLTYIASAIQSNIRALEGAVTRLMAYSSIMKVAVSPELAQSVLGEYFIEKPLPTRKTSVDEIIEAVAQQFGTTSGAIKGTARNKEVSLARHVAMYLCRELLPEVNTRIMGAALGGRDHTTIVHAYQKIRSLLEVDQDLAALIRRLSRELST